MFTLHLFVVILLFAVATQVSGRNAISEIIVRTDIKGRLLTPAEGCGISKVINPRIVGGSAAKDGAWPWMAIIGRRNGTERFLNCDGTLISSRHVLSAAHCFKKERHFVRLGAYDLPNDKNHIDIPIERVERHENYNNNTKINDIAIVYLARDVEFTDRIRPICLPTEDDMQNRSFVGTNPFVAGWGRVSEESKKAHILQQVQLPVITNDECKQKYKEANHFQEGAEFRFNEKYVLCAGFSAGGKSACYGDSGGPMMLPIYDNGRFSFYQIGVISYGLGCARPNNPGVYTNVQKFIDWITEKLQ